MEIMPKHIRVVPPPLSIGSFQQTGFPSHTISTSPIIGRVVYYRCRHISKIASVVICAVANRDKGTK
jgi:hypothetical protein